MELPPKGSYLYGALAAALLVAAGAARWLVPVAVSEMGGEGSQAPTATAAVQILLLIGAGLALRRARGHEQPGETEKVPQAGPTWAHSQGPASPPKTAYFPARVKPTLSIREVGDVTVLDMAGRFDLEEASALLPQRIESLLHAQRKRILINTGSSVWYGHTFAALLKSQKLAQGSGGVIKLVVETEGTKQGLRVTGIAPLFETYATESEAIFRFINETPGDIPLQKPNSGIT